MNGGGDNDGPAQVVAALRTPGAEYELTQTIAAFARADPVFASTLARTLISNAIDVDQELLDAAPPEVRCEPEYPLYDRAKRYQGPVDLLLEGSDWALLVEHKIYSDYDDESGQLDRYLTGGEALGLAHWGLIGVTRNPPRTKPPVSGTPGWLGSLLWADLVGPLKSIAPKDDLLAMLWKAMLDTEIDNGDFGVINLSPDAARAWAGWKAGRDQLAAVLRGLVDPTLEALTTHLPQEREANWLRHTRSDGLWLHEDSLNARFGIPDGGRERLRVQFHSWDAELYFTVEARHEAFHQLSEDAREAYRAVAKVLKADGFEADRKSLSYITHKHLSDSWLKDEGKDTTRKLEELIREDVERLAEAGAFDERFDVDPPG